ncbi:hypothetical protein I4U23_031372 [Adineta vaga]|nr:hypothetical protein I4U23_031372 [Adineta vaga]
MASNKCIVHSRKNVSKFHTAVNQLRCGNMFSNDVYEELPKRCCSCNGKKGLKRIDLEILREICKDIMLSLSSTLKFRFSSNINKNDKENDIDDKHTSSNQENTENEFLKVLETFKVTTVTDGCIVHNSKYPSKFNYAVNLIRRGKKFKNDIYHQLPKRCCSCDGKTGLNVIDLNVLISKCDEIAADKSLQPILHDSFHVFTLPFKTATCLQERNTRISRFIGRKGQNLNALQDKYNKVNGILGYMLSIMNLLIKNISENSLENKMKTIERISMYLLRKKNQSITNEISIDEVKQRIIKQWEEANIEPIDLDGQFHFVSLSFKSTVSPYEHRTEIGRFIGKNGQHLRDLQNKYNVCIRIVDRFSRKNVQKKFAKIQDEDKSNKLYLLITNKNKSTTNEIPIGKIEQEITNQWQNGKDLSVVEPNILTILGELYSQNFNSWWCIFLGYFAAVFLSTIYWSFVNQAFFRLCCIVYSTIRWFQYYWLYIIIPPIQFIILSIVFSPLLIWHDIGYIPTEYYCNVPNRNIRGIVWLLSIGYGSPLLFLVIIYIRIGRYLYRHMNTQILIVRQRQQRDLIVIRRIFITVIFLVILQIPRTILFIMLFMTGDEYTYFARVEWFFISCSMVGLSLSMVIFTPQLKMIILKVFHLKRILPTNAPTTVARPAHL